MDYAMHADLREGHKFSSFELPDHKGRSRNRSQLVHGFPGVLLLGWGHFCPKDCRQFSNYVNHLQPEFRAKTCTMITSTVNDRLTTNEVRDALGADGPFLVDSDRVLMHQLETVDTTDSRHGDVYIPYSFILDRDRTIYRVYNGWWYLGRPTVHDIRTDLRVLMSRRHDWVYSGKEPAFGGRREGQ